MDACSIPQLLVAVVMFLLTIFVLSKNSKSGVNIAFAVMTVVTLGWLIGDIMLFSSKNELSAVFWSKIAFSAVILIPVMVYQFVVFLLKLKTEKVFLPLFYLFAIVLIILINSTIFIVEGVYQYSWGRYPKGGRWLFLSACFYLILFGRTLYLLIKRYSLSADTTQEERNRIKYLLFAMVFAAIAGVDFIPMYGIYIYPIGYFFVAIFLFVIAYTIVRHQLMGIEVIIKKTLVFTGLLAAVFAILVLPTLLIQEYIFRGAHAGGRLAGITLSGIIIILSLRRIDNFLINITDKYLFQKKYDYKELLKTFTGEVLTVLNLDKLVNLTVDKLTDTVKLNACAVLLLDDDKQQFNVVASRNVRDPKIRLNRPDGIVTFLEQTRGYLLRKELVEKKIYIPPDIQEIIDRLNAELIIPMTLHGEVIGILSLGKKKSDEDYSQDDLDILLPLARTLAIAISNAKLFNELGRTQAEAAQKEKMAVIGTLSAGINHEICNPLGIARGQCEAFLLNIRDGLYNDKSSEELLTKAKDIMGKVIKETDRATAITKKLSSFAKPAKGEAELVNIDKEVDDVLGLVGYELKLEKIDFEKHIENGLPNIMVDRKQFQEVLFNLIRNAGQAIGEKGRITVSAIQDTGKVFIDVKDTGSGIPEDKLKELFNPFFTTKDPGKGTGLGLFIVRQVVEKNGGKIYLKHTKVGEGTTFTVEFPAAVPQESKV